MKLSSTTTTAPTTGGSDGVAGFMTSFGTMAMMLFSTVTTLTPTTTTALSFDTSSVGNNDLAGDMLSFVARTYVPYGPDLLANPPQSPSDQPWTGLGYGLGATEHWAFDTKEKYVYSQSEAPGGQFITVLDFGASDDGTGVVSEFSFDVSDRGEIRDLVVCSERGWLFVSLTDANKVFMYETVKRGSPGVPALVKEIQAGTSPDALKLSNDCTYLAVANQNEGLDITTQGSVNLVSDFESETPTVREVRRHITHYNPLTRIHDMYIIQLLSVGFSPCSLFLFLLPNIRSPSPTLPKKKCSPATCTCPSPWPCCSTGRARVRWHLKISR